MSDQNQNESTGSNPWDPNQLNQNGSTPVGNTSQDSRYGQPAQPGQYGQYSVNTDPRYGKMGEAGYDQNPQGYGQSYYGAGAGGAGYGQNGQYVVVEGEPPVDQDFTPHPGTQIPSRLAGVKGVSVGKRILTRILDQIFQGVILVPVFVISGGSIFAATAPLSEVETMSDDEMADALAPAILGSLGSLALGVIVLGVVVLLLVFFTGYTLGGLVTGVRTIDYTTGKGGGLRAVGKCSAYPIIKGTGIGSIFLLFVWFATRDSAERHWVDRLIGTWVIDARDGRDTHKELKAQRG